VENGTLSHPATPDTRRCLGDPPVRGLAATSAHRDGNADRRLGELKQSADNQPMTNTASRADRIRDILTRAFVPTELTVQDDSAHHAGHAGAQPGGQTHYSVLLVSTAFHDASRVARSRAVHAALAGEFGPAEQGGMHALALTLRTPEEHAAQLSR
jgi:stress-induced morphogen